jgi:AcrR family transcriptional regulator
MCEKFRAISEEKQRTILDAALTEFSERGYHKANTNTICEKAGISKGLLFHYFGSKKAL